MTIRLRGHHLLCMLTYVGKGYSQGFTVNYDRVAALLNAGEEIEIVSGPDDICSPLLCDGGAHCFNQSVTKRDEAALAAISDFLREPVAIGTRIRPTKDVIAKLRAGFAQGALRSACIDCEWGGLCDRVAASGFCDVKIAPQSITAFSP
ncbi:DUF1284 domain-containing protein [Agrobacterium larrymoorei]|uniref:DUF1284 domain-containing protein n=1 Tax=Agrobacterium larrymoorei TaxID=160699 RepID=UPI0015737DA6|nr:DUF1284 domain-containing protein [Agrobacterium larrymoorei]